jgi:hypothetical protein
MTKHEGFPAVPSSHHSRNEEKEKVPLAVPPDFSVTERMKEVREMQRKERRTILKVLGAGVATVAGIGATPAFRDATLEAVASKELLESIESKRRRIREEYGVEVSFDELPTKPEQFESSELRLAKRERGITLLMEELKNLPPVLIKNSPLKLITLRSEILIRPRGGEQPLINTHAVEGYVTLRRNQPRSMELNIDGNTTDLYHLFGWSEGNTRTTFSHELFHAIDRTDETRWMSLNELKQPYAVDDRTKSLMAAVGSLPTPGFSNMYGRTNPYEDRATIYQKFSSIDEYKELFERSMTDTVLAKKMKTIQSYMKDASFGLMDESYWIDRLEGKTDEKYFLEKAKTLLSIGWETFSQRNRTVTREMFQAWKKKLGEEYGIPIALERG